MLPKPKQAIRTDRLKARTLLDAMIRQSFSLQELQEVYFYTGVDWENASGGKADRVRYLIANHLNHGTASRLLAYLNESRPDKDWPVIE